MSRLFDDTYSRVWDITLDVILVAAMAGILAIIFGAAVGVWRLALI